MLFFGLLLLASSSFDAGQSKTAFPNRNDSSDETALDPSYRESDYSHWDGAPDALPEYNTIDEPSSAAAEVGSDVGLSEEEGYFESKTAKAKRWVPTEVSVDQVMQKVLLSRLVNNKDRQGKRQSTGSLSSPTDGDGVTADYDPLPLHRHSSEGGRFTADLPTEPRQFAYKVEADDGHSGHHVGERTSHVGERTSHEGERTSHVGERTSHVGERTFHVQMDDKPSAQRHTGDISKWKIPEPPSDQEKLIRDILILSDYLDRQRARKSRRQKAQQIHRLKNKQ